jgi:hypothetical protein
VTHPHERLEQFERNYTAPPSARKKQLKYRGRLDKTKPLSTVQRNVLSVLNAIAPTAASYETLKAALNVKAIGYNTFMWLKDMGYIVSTLDRNETFLPSNQQWSITESGVARLQKRTKHGG